MSHCKGNNNDKKNLCLEGELHVYIFELFLIFIEIFKVLNCNTHLLSRASVALNDLKSIKYFPRSDDLNFGGSTFSFY